ncbi:hypothetical protein [Archangium violaceum]|uniref:hypothetical protein n=1 Tax=Archangium violaceum TaxID=83451 RepID=UPI0036DC5335
MSVRQVYQDEYFTVLVDDGTDIVRTVRSEKPLDALEELEGILTRLGAVLDELGRSRYGLLADVRATPGRNDPQFEAAMMRLRPLWIGGFRRVGVLVRSTVGMMQIQRHARQDGIERLTSKSEDELLKYLVQDG